MGKIVDPDAAAVAGLVLTARMLAAMVEQGIFSLDKAMAMIKQTATEAAGEDDEMKEAVHAALKSVFPQLNLD